MQVAEQTHPLLQDWQPYPDGAYFLSGAAQYVEEEGKASEHRQRKREAEEADKVEAAPGVTEASFETF